MLKYIGGILIIICGTLGGIYFSLRLKKKSEFLEQYLIFLNRVRTMIEYGNMSVRDIFGELKNISVIEPILTDTEKFLDDGENFENAWKMSVDKNMKEFDKSDIEMIYFFGKSFGVTDKNGEISKIDLHSQMIKERLDMMKNEISSKTKIYRILGMFGGVLAAVMIC